jgi:capsular exopolysaccharide synthesis family protein
MVALQHEISETEKDIRTQITRIKGSINDQYQAAAANEKALGDKIAQLKAEALDLRNRSVTYTILMRDLDTNRSLYDGVLQQYRELGVASDAQSNNVSLLDRAQLPGGPISPSLKKNLLLALALGIAAAAGAVWLIEALDDTFKSAEDLEEHLGLPVLGVIPLYRDPAKNKSAVSELMEDPTSPLAESYRSLRTAIQFSTSDGAPRSVLITSARPEEGKSTIALSLASNFGQLGMRVLLIDADLRNPSLHRMINLQNSIGLSNYLSGAYSNAESHSNTETQRADPVLGIVQQTSIPNLAALTCGPLPPNPAELLAGPRLGVLLTEAAESFDIVIVDAPPIMGLADVPILSTVVDGTILVVEGAKTRRNAVRDALKRLHFARARVVGGVLNKYHAKHAAHSYGFAYAYGYGYGVGAEKYVYGRSRKPALDKPTT